MKWIIKAIVQKTISFFPYSQKVNYLFQKHITKGVILTDELLIDKLTHFKKHFESFQKNSDNNTLDTCLEIGTGWFPVIPICYFLMGAKTIYTIDIAALLKEENLIITIKKILEFNRLNDYLKPDPEKLKVLVEIIEQETNEDIHQILKKLNIHYKIKDASKLDFLKSGSVDFISSNNTYEHIFPNVLEAINKEFYRVLKPNSLMSHFIDMSDHFAHMDNSITIYNFLKYSDKQWNLIDNKIQPQNRLRYKSQKEILINSGFKILDEDVRPGNPDEVKNLKLSHNFSSLTANEIAISHAYVVCRKQ